MAMVAAILFFSIDAWLQMAANLRATNILLGELRAAVIARDVQSRVNLARIDRNSKQLETLQRKMGILEEITSHAETLYWEKRAEPPIEESTGKLLKSGLKRNE